MEGPRKVQIRGQMDEGTWQLEEHWARGGPLLTVSPLLSAGASGAWPPEVGCLSHQGKGQRG